jgi:hypothetical protein
LAQAIDAVKIARHETPRLIVADRQVPGANKRVIENNLVGIGAPQSYGKRMHRNALRHSFLGIENLYEP